MANLEETEEWTEGIYQLEITDPVQGGADGISNTPLKSLANRTLYLKNNKADKNGNAANKFKVANAEEDDEAVSKLQMTNAMNSLSSLTGFKNLIINGCLRVNQRDATSIDETASAYNFDRWYYDGTNFIQYIEDKNIVLSGTYTLSWVGNATATVDGASVSNGGQVTLTAYTQCEVKFNSSDFNFVQLEYGNKKTNFEIRPYSIELELCYRYYESGRVRYYIPGNGTVYDGSWETYKTKKRIVPTIQLTDQQGTVNKISVVTSGSGGTTHGRPYFMNGYDEFGLNPMKTESLNSYGISYFWYADAEIYPI